MPRVFLKVRWGQIYLYTSFVIQFYVRCVAYFWSEIFFFGCESITGRYFVSSFFVLEVHFILQNITFKFQHYFMVVIFLINRGCDIIILLLFQLIILLLKIIVDYTCIKKNVLDMTMNTFTRTFKAVWKLLKLRIKFVLVNPRIKT